MEANARGLREGDQVVITVFTATTEGHEVLRPISESHPQRLGNKGDALEDIGRKHHDMTETAGTHRIIVRSRKDGGTTGAHDAARRVDLEVGCLSQWGFRYFNQMDQHPVRIGEP